MCPAFKLLSLLTLNRNKRLRSRTCRHIVVDHGIYEACFPSTSDSISWPSGARAAQKRPAEQDVDALLDGGRVSQAGCLQQDQVREVQLPQRHSLELTKRRVS